VERRRKRGEEESCKEEERKRGEAKDEKREEKRRRAGEQERKTEWRRGREDEGRRKQAREEIGEKEWQCGGEEGRRGGEERGEERMQPHLLQCDVTQLAKVYCGAEADPPPSSCPAFLPACALGFFSAPSTSALAPAALALSATCASHVRSRASRSRIWASSSAIRPVACVYSKQVTDSKMLLNLFSIWASSSAIRPVASGAPFPAIYNWTAMRAYPCAHARARMAGHDPSLDCGARHLSGHDPSLDIYWRPNCRALLILRLSSWPSIGDPLAVRE
jgi:hypothetical protein